MAVGRKHRGEPPKVVVGRCYSFMAFKLYGRRFKRHYNPVRKKTKRLLEHSGNATRMENPLARAVNDYAKTVHVRQTIDGQFALSKYRYRRRYERTVLSNRSSGEPFRERLVRLTVTAKSHEQLRTNGWGGWISGIHPRNF